jgi:hypothetical protein
MSSQRLLFPEDVQNRLAKLYASRKHTWLHNVSDFPITFSLGCPTEKEAFEQQTTVLSWIAAWRKFNTHAELSWHDRHWSRLGVQQLPERITFSDPPQVADHLGENSRWRRASERYAQLTTRWTGIKTELKLLFDCLADYDDTDFGILQAVVQWFLDNPESGLYPRQVPIPGLHTKWLEARLQILCALVACATRRSDWQTGLSQLGLRHLPSQWRMRILDSTISEKVGGLLDFSAPLDELRRLPIEPANIVIVENLQTLLAFEHLPSTVVLLGMGFRVGELGSINWLVSARSHYYWGDLDTAGLAILDIARGVIPNVSAILMDQHTLLSHQHLWVEEKKQHPSQVLGNLTADESHLYKSLKEQRWGTNIRLEQERLPWIYAWTQIKHAVLAAQRA